MLKSTHNSPPMLFDLRSRIADVFGGSGAGAPLKARAARGSLWLGMGSTLEHGLRMARTMILTRFLAPEAFGLMAIVLAVTGAFEAFTQIGVKEAIIQSSEGDDDDYLNGAWFVSVIRAGLLFACAWFAAPLILGFYGAMELAPMLQFVLLSLLFDGLKSPRAYAALKQMNFRLWVMIEQGGAVIGLTTAIVLGVQGYGIWALAIGFTVEAAARCILSFVLCPFRPRLHVRMESLRPLLRYAKGMIGLPIFVFIYGKADVFVVGKVCTATELGLYTIAWSLAQVPESFYSKIGPHLMLPAFASMQEDRERLVSLLLKISKAMACIFFPLFTVMALIAPWLLDLFFGEPYAAVSGTFVILCATAAVRVVARVLATIFFSTGKPHYNRQASFVRLVVMMALIVPLTMSMGLHGAAWATLISSIAWMACNLIRLRHSLGLSMSRYFSTMYWGSTASLIVILIGRMVQ